MNVEKLVFSKLFKEELAVQKIELSLLSDFEKGFNLAEQELKQTEPYYKNIVNNSRELYSNIEKISNEINDVISNFNKLEKASKDLGIDLSSEILGKRGRLNNFLKTTEIIKSDLKKII